jgi:acyl-CoA thioesterase-2
MTTTTVTTDFARWWADVLTVRPGDQDSFEAGPAPSAFPRLYGGQLVAQSLLAAAGTVEGGRAPNSIHVSYLRGGDHRVPVGYRVQRLRESRTLSTRSVHAEQGGQLLATAICSFQRSDNTMRRQVEHDVPGEPPIEASPDSLPTRGERLATAFGDQVPANAALVWPVDVRYVDRAPWEPPVDGTPGVPRNRLWLRAASLPDRPALPDHPLMHAAAFAFASDWPMFEPVLFPHRLEWAEMIAGRSVYGASLDHTVWFHRPIRFDRWLSLSQTAPIAAGTRGFCRAEVRGEDNRLVASVAQEIAFGEPRPI